MIWLYAIIVAIYNAALSYFRQNTWNLCWEVYPQNHFHSSQATLPCASDMCVCTPGYVKCAEQTCCMRYRRNAAKKSRKWWKNEGIRRLSVSIVINIMMIKGILMIIILFDVEKQDAFMSNGKKYQHLWRLRDQKSMKEYGALTVFDHSSNLANSEFLHFIVRDLWLNWLPSCRRSQFAFPIETLNNRIEGEREENCKYIGNLSIVGRRNCFLSRHMKCFKIFHYWCRNQIPALKAGCLLVFPFSVFLILLLLTHLCVKEDLALNMCYVFQRFSPHSFCDTFLNRNRNVFSDCIHHSDYLIRLVKRFSRNLRRLSRVPHKFPVSAYLVTWLLSA